MYNFLSKHGQLIALGIGALITIVMIAIVGANGSTFDTVNAIEGRIEQNAALSATSIFDFGLYSTVALVIITALAVVGFTIFGMATNFKQSKNGLIGLGVLVLIFVVAYFIGNGMGDHQIVKDAITKMNLKTDAGITDGISGGISASLLMAFILGIGAFLLMVAGEIWSLFR